MTAQTLRAALLALLSFLPTATANHFTCNWGGPGNDPAAHGWNYFCTGYRSNYNDFDCDYICELTFRYAYVATFGKIDHADGIIEFNTACNKNGFAPENFCGPSFWGICLGDKAPYSKCWYQQSYDDCQFPEWINRTHQPDKVTIYYISHSMADEHLLASAPRSAAIEGAQDHQTQAQGLTVDDRSPSPPQTAAIDSLPSERPTRPRNGIKGTAERPSSIAALQWTPLPQRTQADAVKTSSPPPQRSEANTVEAPSVLRVKARSLGHKGIAAGKAEGTKVDAGGANARSKWSKVHNAFRTSGSGEAVGDGEARLASEGQKGH